MSETAGVTPQSSSPGRSIPSPCIGICEMGAENGLCTGCARTSEEIAHWRSNTDAWRQSVWDVLPRRLTEMGVSVRRLQMTSSDVQDFFESSVQKASGSWVLGVYGAVGEFYRDPDEPFEIIRDGESIAAVTSRGAIRVMVGSAVRLLAIDGGPNSAAPRAYCLAIHKSKVAIPVSKGLKKLGVDREAIRPAERETPFFDLGLGRDKARFCIRSQNPEVLSVLDAAQGLSLAEIFGQAGPTLLKHSPTRVVETALGRVEVETTIPKADERSPSGPHTHLLPDHLAQNIDTAPGLAIPDVYAVGALFYPKRSSPQCDLDG